MTMNTEAKRINWQPEHFPIGTTVALKDYARRDIEDPHYSCGIFYYNSEAPRAVVTVTSVLHYGADSFLINTGEYNKALGLFHSFNFDHVDHIVKRGNGPVKIENSRSNSVMPNLKSSVSNEPLCKSKYYCTYLPELVNYLIALSTLPKGFLLKDGFYDFFKKQSFVKKEGYKYSGFYSMDKKRARRFVQQNINRWIKPMKEVRKQVEAENKKEYENFYKDMETNFDRDLPIDEDIAGSNADLSSQND